MDDLKQHRPNASDRREKMPQVGLEEFGLDDFPLSAIAKLKQYGGFGLVLRGAHRHRKFVLDSIEILFTPRIPLNLDREAIFLLGAKSDLEWWRMLGAWAYRIRAAGYREELEEDALPDGIGHFVQVGHAIAICGATGAWTGGTGKTCSKCLGKRYPRSRFTNPGETVALSELSAAINAGPAAPPWSRSGTTLIAMRAKYAESKKLRRLTGFPHVVEHIVPLHGDPIVSGLHLPWNVRVITRSELRRRWNGSTPLRADNPDYLPMYVSQPITERAAIGALVYGLRALRSSFLAFCKASRRLLRLSKGPGPS